MIVSSADAIQLAILFTEYAPDIFVQLVAIVLGKGGRSIFGPEDDVVENLSMRGHGSFSDLVTCLKNYSMLSIMRLKVSFAPFREGVCRGRLPRVEDSGLFTFDPYGVR